MTQRYDSAWWSIAIPGDWQVDRDDDCMTITSERGVGVFQLSAYQNETESITNQMLSELASEESVDDISLTELKYGDFEGLATQYREDSTFWRKAWLKNNNILLYATYNCPAGDESIEKEILDDMLLSLKCQTSGL